MSQRESHRAYCDALGVERSEIDGAFPNKVSYSSVDSAIVSDYIGNAGHLLSLYNDLEGHGLILSYRTAVKNDYNFNLVSTSLSIIVARYRKVLAVEANNSWVRTVIDLS